MQNDRPIDNPHIQECLDMFHFLCERYDITGGIYLCDAKEMAFAYHQFATWNANIADANTPMGWRIRAKSNDLGHERAKELIEGSVWTIASMVQFGHQTKLWGTDLKHVIEKQGKMKIESTFPKVPRITGFNAKGKSNG